IVQFGVSEKLGQVSFDFPRHLVSSAHVRTLALTAVLGAGGQGEWGRVPVDRLLLEKEVLKKANRAELLGTQLFAGVSGGEELVEGASCLEEDMSLSEGPRAWNQGWKMGCMSLAH
ncbi:hypothetical protein MC885_009143, partial [Smutsia gigantea]